MLTIHIYQIACQYELMFLHVVAYDGNNVGTCGFNFEVEGYIFKGSERKFDVGVRVTVD